VVYDPVINGRRYNFGVSGLLYKRNLLLFDRQTGSLWSQLLSEAVTGPLAGSRLKVLPAVNTTWSAWKQAHSETRVLSFATGHRRNYREDPYSGFRFPRRPALLIVAGDQRKVYPFSELMNAKSPVIDRLGDYEVRIRFDSPSRSIEIDGTGPGSVTSIPAYLDDLKAFFPEAELYKAPR
jgi:hypothetical protein